MSITRTLTSNGYLPHTIEILSSSQHVQELVHAPLILGEHSEALESDSDESGLGEVDQSARWTRGSGATIDQTHVDLKIMRNIIKILHMEIEYLV